MSFDTSDNLRLDQLASEILGKIFKDVFDGSRLTHKIIGCPNGCCCDAPPPTCNDTAKESLALLRVCRLFHNISKPLIPRYWQAMIDLSTRCKGQIPLRSDPESLSKVENVCVRTKCEARNVGWSLPLAWLSSLRVLRYHHGSSVYSGHFDVPLETLRSVRNGTGLDDLATFVKPQMIALQTGSDQKASWIVDLLLKKTRGFKIEFKDSLKVCVKEEQSENTTDEGFALVQGEFWFLFDWDPEKAIGPHTRARKTVADMLKVWYRERPGTGHDDPEVNDYDEMEFSDDEEDEKEECTCGSGGAGETPAADARRGLGGRVGDGFKNILRGAARALGRST